jgi:hypothetical protein
MSNGAGPSPFALAKLVGVSFPSQSYIEIAGIRSPGKATIHNFSDERGFDERRGYGNSGATLVPTGDKLKTFDILFELWNPFDFPAWTAFANAFFTRSLMQLAGGAAALALTIDHPVLKAPPFKVSSCVVIGGSSALENDGYGLWSCTIKFKEFRKAQPALPKPLGAIPDVSTPPPVAQDQLDVTIQALSNQIAAAAGP